MDVSSVLRTATDASPAANFRSEQAELASRAAKGDAAATTHLLRIVAPEMSRVVRGVMGPYSAEVEDALQQALVALVHALPSFRGECTPAGYACRIAFRTALAVRKSVHRVRAFHDDSADPDLVPDGRCPAAASDRNRRLELVRKLLSEIPPEQAEALALRTMLGWTLEEIAQASGAPVNTVRSRLRLAKEALRRAVEGNPALAEEFGVGP